MSKKLSIHILFAELDNQPILKNRGWVSFFEKFLYMMLRQTTDQPFQIHLISDQEEASSVAPDILIPLLSPDFVLSGICLDRLEQYFLDNSTLKEDVLDSRIFTVFKAPLDYVDIPPRLKPYTTYNLFLNEDDDKREFSEFFSEEAEKNYWMKMVDLSFDIYEAMIQITSEEMPKKKSSYKRKAVYLSDTGQDLSGARNIIKRELLRHGYEVYPKANLPHKITALKESIGQDLTKCQYSLHLIGGSYGPIPNGSEMSVMDLQNEMAAERSRNFPAKLSRLIWISPSLKYASEKQKAFIHNLKRDSHASIGAEVLQTSLEDFKNTLWEELIDGGLNKKLRLTVSDLEEKQPVLYLLYDPVDEEKLKPVIKKLEKSTIKVITPPRKGELMELRNQHIDALKQMDAAIVFQNAVNDQWVHMKLLDLLKAPGFGRSKPIIDKLFLTNKSKDIEKEYASRYEVKVDNSADYKKLDNFIKLIESNFQKNYESIKQ
ncbi:DUF4062 domain-containing protein [Marivirga sp. S37H4]|uniref:DUF4062 domain-containing protein n=1 Tax=Marivirga aurantiaca TaxID=2802615 RepID=A0A935CBG0_9BACT|nr:DUF4062 domain-containing protein [Marivirga aurantiaca]MBK6267130.1 DUF4062 domain-containing protein [Marivirga aurantiaca]